jgi:ferredoxin like protein
MSLSDRLHTLKYTPDTGSHLKPDLAKCAECTNKACTFVCPAQVYDCDSGEMIVNYENCLECGACRLACEHINWQYPRGTKGVMFKHG